MVTIKKKDVKKIKNRLAKNPKNIIHVTKTDVYISNKSKKHTKSTVLARSSRKFLTKLCPVKICLYAISAVENLIFAAIELLFAGVDPNQMRFKRTGCFDVGLESGGWGNIIMEIKVVDRKSLKKSQISEYKNWFQNRGISVISSKELADL